MIEGRFSAAARSDMLDIVVFIARDNPRAAEDWLAAIEERCRVLAGHPLTGELRPGFGVADCRGICDLFSAHSERCQNCSGCAWKPRPRPTLKHPGLRGPGNRSITLAPGDTG